MGEKFIDPICSRGIRRFSYSHKRGASHAVRNLKEMRPPVFAKPVSLEVTFLVADMAEMTLWIRGVERLGPRTITIRSDDLLELYRMFVTVVTLTRSLVDH